MITWFCQQIGGVGSTNWGYENYHGEPVSVTQSCDLDGDYRVAVLDCNDNDPTVYPGAPEINNNGIDNNCDGLVAEQTYGQSCRINAPSPNVKTGSSTNVVSGNLFHSQSVGSGLNISYNSLNGQDSPLGRGWAHDYNIRIVNNGPGFGLTFHGPDGRVIYYHIVDTTTGTYEPETGYAEHSQIVLNADGTYTQTTKEGIVYDFDATGALTAITDRNNNQTILSYDTNGNLTSITDFNGRVTTLAYDANNHIISYTSPGGNTTTFGYDASNTYLTSITDPAGGSWLFTYDPNSGMMLTKTDPNNNQWQYAYDASNRLQTSTDPQGNVKTISYDPANNVTTVTEKDGGVWKYTYDPAINVVLKVTDPNLIDTTYVYDTNGMVTSKTEPGVGTTTYSYDADGNMLTKQNPLGETTTYTYDTYGHVLTVQDPQGLTTTYAYDMNTGNLLSVTDPAGAVTSYQYDTRGNVTQITDADGNATGLVYDANNNLVAINYPLGGSASFTYDADGNPISYSPPAGSTVNFAYDGLGRLTTITEHDSQGNPYVTRFTYDAAGNRTVVTDANNTSTQFAYDPLNRLKSVTDALGNITDFTYGSAGCTFCGGGVDKLVSLTNALGNSTNFQYDTLGQLQSETDPLGNVTSYAYDVAGNIVSRTDGNGDTITYAYDSLGRLVKKTYPDGTTANFAYDLSGRLIHADNTNISYDFTYDGAGRVTKVTDSRGVILDNTYSLAGRRTQMTATYNGSVALDISYTYDSRGRVVQIAPVGINPFDLVYDQSGRRTSLTYPTGSTAAYTYDARGRLTSLTHTSSTGSTIASFTYTYDKTMHRLSKAEPGKTHSYYYDGVYRLTHSVPVPPDPASNDMRLEDFTHDAVGNRLTGPDSIEQYTYDADNRLLSLLLSTPLTTAEDFTYTYDYENRLVQVDKVVGGKTTTVKFKYDPFGRRIQKRVSTTQNGQNVVKTYIYIYDREDVIIERLSTTIGGGTPTVTTKKYVHGPGVDEPLAVAKGGSVYYYHADGLGSVVALTDFSEATVEGYNYDTFGRVERFGNAVQNTYGFTGREYDAETGLYYYRGRYYDPETGRFISKDPIGFAGGDANLYNYVLGDAINWTDPWGLQGPDDLARAFLGMNYDEALGYALEQAQRVNEQNKLKAKKAKFKADFCESQAKLYRDLGDEIVGIPPTNGGVADIAVFLISLGLDFDAIRWTDKAEKYKTQYEDIIRIEPIWLYDDIIPIGWGSLSKVAK